MRAGIYEIYIPARVCQIESKYYYNLTALIECLTALLESDDMLCYSAVCALPTLLFPNSHLYILPRDVSGQVAKSS